MPPTQKTPYKTMKHWTTDSTYALKIIQSNIVNMNSTGPSKKFRIKRNFTLTVARCMGVIIPGDFKVVHIKRYSL